MWAGQDLAPPPDIASGGYERSPPESSGALRRSARCRQARWLPGEWGMDVFVKWLSDRLLRDYTWSKMSTYDLVKCWRRIVCVKRDKRRFPIMVGLDRDEVWGRRGNCAFSVSV